MILPTPSVLTVIVNWRTPGMTLRSAEAALRAMEGIAGAITIVDNDSGDGSFDRLTQSVLQRGWKGRVQVLQSGHNGGFGAGNNLGIRAGLPDGTQPDYVYILNSDAFPAPGAIRHLLDHLQSHPQVGFAGSYIHGLDGEPHLTTFRFPSIRSELEGAARIGPISRMLRDHIVALPVPDSTVRADWLAGCSLMMRRRMLDEIGLFDEGYFLYFEETDLCLRAAQEGWPADYVRASEVAHIGSESTGMGRWMRVPTYWLDSRLRYFVKSRGRGAAALATLAHLTGGALCLLRVSVQGGKTGVPPYFLRDMARHALRNLWRGGAMEPQHRIAGAAMADTVTVQARWKGH